MAIRVSAPRFLVLADGKSDGERNNTRGHLFEKFVARLLSEYGYAAPTVNSLNVTANGIEIDVATKLVVSGEEAIAECKAYGSSLSASFLDTFYGKLGVLRLSTPSLQGIFVALPGLTPPGMEQARTISAGDARFRLLTATEVSDLLLRRGWVIQPPTDRLLADEAVVITEHGIFAAAKELEVDTRVPNVVRVWGAGESPPAPVLSLVAESDYAGALEVRRLHEVVEFPVNVPAEPVVVEVAGSTSDFEYQLPASPGFFVGRQATLSYIETVIAASKDRGQVVVLNAQSGWGKSSLALRVKALVQSRRGFGIVIDSRTATSVDFVRASLRRAAVSASSAALLTLPSTTSFASVADTIDTLERATWPDRDRPLLIFFDQFENVFTDERLTREFRDLALLVAETSAPIVVGFAWKTDLIAWTESHPYRLRDEIRSRSTVVTVDPLGPPEITTLLRRLEKALGSKLSGDLARRLREYSQGLPWLFKKLGSHILREIGEGSTQEELVAEALNVQRLFESDLRELSPSEQEALHVVARMAPVPISDLLELVRPPVLQSLLDRRLAVQVGERLDIYWDIFRDFLNTGRVPIQETYILRLTPTQVAKLLKVTIDAGGDLGVAEAAHQLKTTDTVIFNAARDLRQMGVLVKATGRVRVAEEILAAANKEDAVRERISQALKRHRAYSLLVNELELRDSDIPIAEYAEKLPEAFPAVSAQPKTWAIYARAFVHWFVYARLIAKLGDYVGFGAPQVAVELLGPARIRTRTKGTFPQSSPGPAIHLAGLLMDRPARSRQFKQSTIRKALTDLAGLGVIDLEGGAIRMRVPSVIRPDGTADPAVLRTLIERIPGGLEALELFESGTRGSAALGEPLRKARGATWAAATTALAGKHFRGWARVALETRSLRSHDVPGQLYLGIDTGS